MKKVLFFYFLLCSCYTRAQTAEQKVTTAFTTIKSYLPKHIPFLAPIIKDLRPIVEVYGDSVGDADNSVTAKFKFDPTAEDLRNGFLYVTLFAKPADYNLCSDIRYDAGGISILFCKILVDSMPTEAVASELIGLLYQYKCTVEKDTLLVKSTGRTDAFYLQKFVMQKQFLDYVWNINNGGKVPARSRRYYDALTQYSQEYMTKVAYKSVPVE